MHTNPVLWQHFGPLTANKRVEIKQVSAQSDYVHTTCIKTSATFKEHIGLQR